MTALRWPGTTPGWRGSAGSCAPWPASGDHRGRRLPLDYLVAVAVAAGSAGDDSPDAAAFSRVLGQHPRHAQQVDDALCA
ncbi:MAG TPA: hypothetical protein VF070_48755 [Streptosporangiaceae bacterium]